MKEIVRHARQWRGTPFVHGASTRGQGADCLGLILGIWRDLGLPPPVVPPYRPGWFVEDSDDALMAALTRYAMPAGSAWAAGDILAFRMKPAAPMRHLGVLTAVGECPRFIHALARHGVVEVSLSAPWRRHVVARFCFPDPARPGASQA